LQLKILIEKKITANRKTFSEALRSVAKRCEALRSVAKRCEALRSVAKRCEALRSVAKKIDLFHYHKLFSEKIMLNRE
jgi:hypothetical protein